MSVTPSVQAPTPPSAPSAPVRPPGWTAGRVVSLVTGCVLGLVSLGLLAAGGLATWETNTQRDAAGYLSASAHTIATSGYVITSDEVGELVNQVPAGVLGTTRVRATATNPTTGVFIGIGPKAAVDSYLSGVNRRVITGWFPFATRDDQGTAAAPRTGPLDAGIWTAHVAGPGTQTLNWRPAAGSWTVVVMRPNGGAGLSATADVGATVPDLAWFAVALFAVGVVLGGAAAALIAVPLARARR